MIFLLDIDNGYKGLSGSLRSHYVKKNGKCDELYMQLKFKSVSNKRQKSRSVSNQRLIESTSLHHTNRSPSNQEARTPEISRKYSTTTTVQTSSVFGINSNIGVSVTAGTDLAFAKVVKVEGTVTGSLGISYQSTNSNSKTTSEERTVSAPSQVVTVHPYSRTDVTTNFFSNDITIVYIVDAVLDDETSFVCHDLPPEGVDADEQCRQFLTLSPLVLLMLENSYKHYPPGPDQINFLKDCRHGHFYRDDKTSTLSADRDSIKVFISEHPASDNVHFAFENGSFLIKNIPVSVKTTGYEVEISIKDKEGTTMFRK